MTADTSTEAVEKLARQVAFWHGQKIVYHKPGEGAMTVASMHGYGKWADAADRYARDHWQQYRAIAENVVAPIIAQRDALLAAVQRIAWGECRVCGEVRFDNYVTCDSGEWCAWRRADAGAVARAALDALPAEVRAMLDQQPAKG